jgi:hypothetical protein
MTRLGGRFAAHAAPTLDRIQKPPGEFGVWVIASIKLEELGSKTGEILRFALIHNVHNVRALDPSIDYGEVPDGSKLREILSHLEQIDNQ